MGVYGAKAEGLKAEIANNQAALAADQAEANALSQTIQMVQMLKSCVTDLENTIQKAIDALSGMSKTFGQQAADLTSIATNWDQVQQGADTSDIDDRTLTMQTAIDGAKSAWAEVSQYLSFPIFEHDLLIRFLSNSSRSWRWTLSPTQLFNTCPRRSMHSMACNYNYSHWRNYGQVV